MRAGRHWSIHSGISDLAEDVSRRDGVALQLRIGLNSGQVIAGEIGSAAVGLHRDR